MYHAIIEIMWASRDVFIIFFDLAFQLSNSIQHGLVTKVQLIGFSLLFELSSFFQGGSEERYLVVYPLIIHEVSKHTILNFLTIFDLDDLNSEKSIVFATSVFFIYTCQFL